MNPDIKAEITHAFDAIVNEAWGAAKDSDADKLTVKECYAAIDRINSELTKLKQILYSRKPSDK